MHTLETYPLKKVFKPGWQNWTHYEIPSLPRPLS